MQLLVTKLHCSTNLCPNILFQLIHKYQSNQAVLENVPAISGRTVGMLWSKVHAVEGFCKNKNKLTLVTNAKKASMEIKKIDKNTHSTLTLNSVKGGEPSTTTRCCLGICHNCSNGWIQAVCRCK